MARRRKRSKKWVSWLVILVLLVAAGIVGYKVWDEYFNEKKEEEVVDIENGDEVEIKKDEATTIQEAEEKKETVLYEGESPNAGAALTGVVTYAAAAGTDLLIRVNIDQYLAEGSCTLNLITGGNTIYSDAARIVNSASTATCEGFNVPLSQISGGNYKILINLVSGDKTGIIEGEVNI